MQLSLHTSRYRNDTYVSFPLEPIIDAFMSMSTDTYLKWSVGGTDEDVQKLVNFQEIAKIGFPRFFGNDKGERLANKYYRKLMALLTSVYAPKVGFRFDDDTNISDDPIITVMDAGDYNVRDAKAITSIIIEDAEAVFFSQCSVPLMFKNCNVTIVNIASSLRPEFGVYTKFINCKITPDAKLRIPVDLALPSQRYLKHNMAFGEVTNCTFTNFTFSVASSNVIRSVPVLSGCKFVKCKFERAVTSSQSTRLAFTGCQLDGCVFQGMSLLLDSVSGSIEHSMDWKDSKGVRTFERHLHTIYCTGDQLPAITFNEFSNGAKVVNTTDNELELRFAKQNTKYRNGEDVRLDVIGKADIVGDPGFDVYLGRCETDYDDNLMIMDDDGRFLANIHTDITIGANAIKKWEVIMYSDSRLMTVNDDPYMAITMYWAFTFIKSSMMNKIPNFRNMLVDVLKSLGYYQDEDSIKSALKQLGNFMSLFGAR